MLLQLCLTLCDPMDCSLPGLVHQVSRDLVQSLGWEDILEEEMLTHSSSLAWEIPWTEQPDGLQSMGSQKSWTQLSTYTHTHTQPYYTIGNTKSL